MTNWLILHYKLPTKPSALRVYIWRKLKRLGAILLHEAIWILPDQLRTAEQVQWLTAEIQEMGGEAYSWRANAILGENDETLIQQFNEQVDAVYSKLLKKLEKTRVDLQEISHEYQQAASQDFFHSKLGLRVREKCDIETRRKIMKWVTWENIGVDRMASAWLIRCWIDSETEFSFIPVGEKPKPKAGEPFDIPGERYSHHGGHCTFYALLKEYKLNDPVLTRIAQIIDEADEIQEVTVEPAAKGLDLICRGLRHISKDDFEAIERGSLIYDALYAELSRNEV